MGDRELLELAARAAGYEIEFDYYGDGRHGRFVIGSGFPPLLWNPLTDDGDALRLAVKLRLATRRAIVRAAAEIGRAMP